MAKILVIDDEPGIRELLNAVLTRKGHEVVLASDGQKGLELFHEERPHLTILDLAMPVVDGLTVLKRIRAVDPRAPVIIQTGVGTEAQEKQARELGVAEFLQKGFSLHVLGEALKRVLSGSIQGPTSGSRPWTVRNYPRGRVAVKVSYQTPDHRLIENLTGDIGGGGLFIESREPLVVGTAIAMKLLLPDDPSAPLQAKGRVTWIRPTGISKQLFAGMGVQFTDISEIARTRVMEMVGSLEKMRQGS